MYDFGLFDFFKDDGTIFSFFCKVCAVTCQQLRLSKICCIVASDSMELCNPQICAQN